MKENDTTADNSPKIDATTNDDLKNEITSEPIDEREAYWHEKREEGCGSLYFSLTDIARIIKVMNDLICDSSLEVSSHEIDGYRLTAERDAFDEDHFHFTKQKII